MIQKQSRYRILQEFFDSPRKDFQVRELCRITKITQPSVTNHLKALVNSGFLIKEKKGVYPSFRANRENEEFRFYKKLDILQRMQDIGLISHIYDSCSPDCIILFGSAAKGEDIEESDIDLFVQAKENPLALDSYGKKLNRKITLFFEEDFSRLSNELKNNVLNGSILKGYIKVF